MTLLALFFAGAFLSNAIPHIAAGTRGEPFPTPFAKPHGVGLSSPLINVLWGTLNLVVGLVLLDSHPIPGAVSLEAGVVLAGFLLLGVFAARHFGKVRAGKV